MEEHLWGVAGGSLVFFLCLIAYVLSMMPSPQKIELKRPPRAESPPHAMISDEPPQPIPKEVLEEMFTQVAQRMNVSMSQVKTYWNSFARYDVDNSGSVDAKELRAMLVDSIGYHPSDEELLDIVREVDADGSGTLEFPEASTA
jgi:hypothetical protein